MQKQIQRIFTKQKKNKITNGFKEYHYGCIEIIKERFESKKLTTIIRIHVSLPESVETRSDLIHKNCLSYEEIDGIPSIIIDITGDNIAKAGLFSNDVVEKIIEKTKNLKCEEPLKKKIKKDEDEEEPLKKKIKKDEDEEPNEDENEDDLKDTNYVPKKKTETEKIIELDDIDEEEPSEMKKLPKKNKKMWCGCRSTCQCTRCDCRKKGRCTSKTCKCSKEE